MTNTQPTAIAKPYLVKDINPGLGGSFPSELTNLNGTLYFATTGGQLWKSDGTVSGTVLVKDLSFFGFDYIRGSVSHLINVNSILYFSGDDIIHGTELWKSDGTSQGTVLVKDINPGGYVDSYPLSPSNVAFSGSFPSSLTNIGDTLYFISDNGLNSGRLWKTDGTLEGTILVKDFSNGNTYSYDNENDGSISSLTNVNNTLYFTVGYSKYDGSLYYRSELWKSDGSAAGTVLVRELTPGWVDEFYWWLEFDTENFTYKRFSYLANVNGTLYFTADDGTHGIELWKSDDTSKSTVLVKDINPGSDSSILYAANLTNFNGILYFIADDGTHGRELWKSDGTANGTTLIKDINSGSGESDISNLTDFNGILYFIADDGTHGKELWKSDGTTNGTILLKDINPGSVDSSVSYLSYINSTLYFIADDGTHGKELWKSDGTIAGTVLVKDINPGVSGSINDLSIGFTNFNDTLYFVADDGTHGKELWKSDGTAQGTVLVEDINPGAGNSDVSNLVNVDDILYFRANNGTNGIELWALKTNNFNIINGSNGSRDPLTGTAGSDRIIGGTGSKTITGGAGDDEFVYTSIREVGHRISDFTVGEDKIVLTQLLDSLVTGAYNGGDAIADGYVKLVQGSTANSTVLQIDRDGVGEAIFRPFIQLDNVTPQAMGSLSSFVF